MSWRSGYSGGDDEEEANEQDEDEVAVPPKKIGIVLLINAVASMTARDAQTQEIPFQMCMKIASEILTAKVIEGANTPIGICLYNTTVTKNNRKMKGIYVLQELEIPDAQRIRQLNELAGLQQGDFGHEAVEAVTLDDALWHCQFMFDENAMRITQKEIHLFTNNDRPDGGDASKQSNAEKRASEFTQSLGQIHLYSFNPSDHQFDVRAFYHRILERMDTETGDVVERYQAVNVYEQLKEAVKKKIYTQRSVGAIDFSVAPGIDMGVRVYNMFMPQPKPSPVWVTARDYHVVKTRTKLIDSNTGAVVAKEQLASGYTYGNETLHFTHEEVTKMKDLGPQGLVLMGFKPMSTLKEYHNITHPSFIYPDENRVKGSTKLFSALLQAMVGAHKYAVVRYIARKGYTPKFVALLSQPKVTDPNMPDMPQGMHLIPLPYADDIRMPPVPPSPAVASEQVDAVTAAIRKIRIGTFRPEDFPNPTLNKYYAHLTAAALGEAPREVQDVIIPPNTDRARDLLDIARHALYPDGAVGRPVGRKREAVGGGARARPAPVMSEEQWKEMVADERRLKKLTVAELKDKLKALNVKVPAGTRKDDLMLKLKDYYDSH